MLTYAESRNILKDLYKKLFKYIQNVGWIFDGYFKSGEG